MRQFVYFIFVFLLLGCANNNAYKTMEAAASEDTYVLEDTEESSYTSLEDAYSILISEKLQDYVDKQALIAQHPDFRTTEKIKELFQIKTAKEIQKITFVGPPNEISDSITKIVTKVDFGNAKIDTIISYIKTSSRMIDGVLFKTSKVTFERLKSSKETD